MVLATRGDARRTKPLRGALARANRTETQSMNYQTLEVRREGAVAWLTLDRPHSLNALSAQMVDELEHFLKQLPADHSTRVIVMRGAGRAFCAGLDLKEQNRGDSGIGSSTVGSYESQRRMSDLVVMMRRAPQPFIGAVRGPAAGGGFALALACDVRIAAESARFNAAFIRIGLSACDMGVSYHLPRIVGMTVASELLLTGRFINSERALRTGLVSEVVPDDQLDAAAAKLAQEMIETSPLGLRLTKECMWAAADAGSLEQACAIEDRNQILCVKAGYLEEGARAFIEKRKPRFAERA
jgi:enoyl-CoA hydratase